MAPPASRRRLVKGDLVARAAAGRVDRHAGLRVEAAAATTASAEPAAAAASTKPAAALAVKAAAAAEPAAASASAKPATASAAAESAATSAAAGSATAARGVEVNLEPSAGHLLAVELGGLLLGVGRVKLDKANALELARFAVRGEADVDDSAVVAKGLGQRRADCVLALRAVKALDEQGRALRGGKALVRGRA